MSDIKSMTIEEVTELVAEAGEPAFRAGQLFSWMHEKRVRTYEEMTNLPKKLRGHLAASYPLTALQQVDSLESARGDTQKYLFALPDGNVIESVRMCHRHGISVCISSQAGCRMGCRFCASTIDGLARSLAASEMLEQIYEIGRTTEGRISHIDIMGSGEPLDNLGEVLRFIRLVTDPKGMNLSQRNITLSTCGLVPEIRRLAKERLAVTLAISLHAPDDALRKGLMPGAARYTIAGLLEACDDYFRETGRRISYEYALIAGENDSPGHAEALGRLLRGRGAHVNLIPVNAVEERSFHKSAGKVVHDFQIILEKYGINVTIRKEMGADIDGACGQLRKRYLVRRKSV